MQLAPQNAKTLPFGYSYSLKDLESAFSLPAPLIGLASFPGLPAWVRGYRTCWCGDVSVTENLGWLGRGNSRNQRSTVLPGWTIPAEDDIHLATP